MSSLEVCWLSLAGVPVPVDAELLCPPGIVTAAINVNAASRTVAAKAQAVVSSRSSATALSRSALVVAGARTMT